jgi:hypothetical protein
MLILDTHIPHVSNPETCKQGQTDCFVAYATRNDVASDGLNKNSALLDQILLEDRHLELE